LRDLRVPAAPLHAVPGEKVMNGRDRLCRPTSWDPHSRFPFHLYEVGKVDRGDHGKKTRKI
jgi:hypothetical protein